MASRREAGAAPPWLLQLPPVPSLLWTSLSSLAHEAPSSLLQGREHSTLRGQGSGTGVTNAVLINSWANVRSLVAHIASPI